MRDGPAASRPEPGRGLIRLARNPAKGIRLPPLVHREMHFLTARQLEALAAAIDRRYSLLMILDAYTGSGPAS